MLLRCEELNSTRLDRQRKVVHRRSGFLAKTVNISGERQFGRYGEGDTNVAGSWLFRYLVADGI